MTLPAVSARARACALAATMLASACGAPTPGARGPAGGGGSRLETPPDPPPMAVEYVVIKERWVERFVPAPEDEVEAWAVDPANAALLAGSLRHVLVQVPSDAPEAVVARAKKKAETVLSLANKGEDFSKLAAQYSDDTASKDRGGEYPRRAVAQLATPVQQAYERLAPGETATALVRSEFGFHVVRKDRARGDELERAFRHARAPEATKRLADVLLARLSKGEPSRAAIATSVETVFGERASADANRPQAAVVDREHLGGSRLPAAAKAALTTFARGAKPGEALPSPAVDGDVIVVARAVAPAAR